MKLSSSLKTLKKDFFIWWGNAWRKDDTDLHEEFVLKVKRRDE
jgi:hypothetical protein